MQLNDINIFVLMLDLACVESRKNKNLDKNPGVSTILSLSRLLHSVKFFLFLTLVNLNSDSRK